MSSSRQQKLGEAHEAEADHVRIQGKVLADLYARRLTVGEAGRKLSTAVSKERKARAHLREYDLLNDAKRMRQSYKRVYK